MKKPSLLAIVLILAFGACSEGRVGVSSSSSDPLVDEISTEFISLMRHFERTYEPAATPADLAKQADAVVTGTIEDVKPGQSYAEEVGGKPVIATSVLAVRTNEVLLGDRALVTDDFVYIEIPHPAFLTIGKSTPGTEGSGEEDPFDHAAYAKTVPRAHGVFFLADRTAKSYSDAVINEGRGRPEGARITAPYTQGFILEGENGEAVSVLEPFETMPPAWQELSSIEEIVTLLKP